MPPDKYSSLSYQIARFYLYIYPDSDTTRISLAEPWLEKATENENPDRETAQLMYNIISFNNKVNIWLKDNNAKEFAESMQAFESSIAIAHDGTDNNLKYNVYQAALYVLRQKNVVAYLHKQNYTKSEILNIVKLDDISGLLQEEQKNLNEWKAMLETQINSEYGGD